MTGALLDLERRDYKEVWELQKRLVELRTSNLVGNVLILVEHEPVITLGRKTSLESFRPRGIPAYRVERGGDATYHGPGQLVGYPILLLMDHDIHRYLRMLEDVLIMTLAVFGIDGARKEGQTGVWVADKKVASIGVAVKNWVTYHGFALNVNTDLTYFRLIRPCGMDPSVMTSMKEISRREFGMKGVGEAALGAFEAVFREEFESKSLVALPPARRAGKIKYAPGGRNVRATEKNYVYDSIR